jgi:hypothetical protein
MHRGKSARRMRRFAARGMKRTLNEIARNKFDEAAADRRHRENPHGDKVREVSAAFAENRPPRFEARATLSGSQQRLPRAGIGTRAAAARRMVLPIRILQLCRAALATKSRRCWAENPASRSRAFGV